MANNENSSAPVPDSQQLMRTDGYGDSAGADGQRLAVAGMYGAPNFSRTPHVVNGGMDASWFINSLRRRWLLATCMGLLLAALVGGLLFWLFPESDTAIARFLVKAEQDTMIYRDIDTSRTEDYDIFRATQIAQIRNFDVLDAALKDKKLQNVKALKEADDRFAWLQENIDVNFVGESELLQVSMTLDESTENLENLVNAVCLAYLDKVVMEDRNDRYKVRDALSDTHRKMKEEIRKKWDDYLRIAKEIGVAQDGNFDPTVHLLRTEISEKMKAKARLENEIMQIRQEYLSWQAWRDNPELKEMKIQQQAGQNEDLMIMDQQLLGLRMEQRAALDRSGGRKSREVNRIQKKIDSLTQQKNSLYAQLEAEVRAAEANKPDVELQLYGGEFQRRLQFAMAQLQQLEQGRDVPNPDDPEGEPIHEPGLVELRQEFESKAENSTDLMVRRAELEQLETVANDLARRIEAWDIELQAKPRIELQTPPYVVPGINRLQRYAIAGVGSGITFILTCLGIAFMEFLGRRLNGPEQLDEGLGIRVVGTLPALNAKRMMNPKHPLVAQLTESIDSVRTALMHDSTSKPRQVVLVTSPSAMEGRTTVASQLAASLARAGRRTLLIDGDLRRPALHGLFDVPLEDGLCEVLRAEAEVTDVVRATHAEGLWLMTAGYCDADAVHAMATDQIQPIFEKLRAEYDFVIIDGAPVLGLSDSLMIGQHCDGALLSVLRDQTSVPKIYQASELLRGVGVRLVGSVVNGVSSKADRRVTHLQVASPKAARKQLEAQVEKPAKAATVVESGSNSADNGPVSDSFSDSLDDQLGGDIDFDLDLDDDK